jgi:hypothetical protein
MYHFCRCHVEKKGDRIRRVKRYWEIIADNLSKAGWSWGCVSAIDREGRTIWIADIAATESVSLCVSGSFLKRASIRP